MKNYPDISDLLARKEKRRREIRRLSFGEKIAMAEKMRERLAPLKRMRGQRRHSKEPSLSSRLPINLQISEQTISRVQMTC